MSTRHAGIPLFERCVRASKGSDEAESRAAALQARRESVRRELSALFNATRLASVTELDSYPQVRRSALNYGLPDLSGRTASGIDRVGLEHELLQAIRSFE